MEDDSFESSDFDATPREKIAKVKQEAKPVDTLFSKVRLLRKQTEDALSGKLSSRRILLRKATGMHGGLGNPFSK